MSTAKKKGDVSAHAIRGAADALGLDSGDLARGVEARGGTVTGPDLRTDGALDPCMPVRNLGGHLVDCNYGDWPDFSKCDCAEGLAGIPAKRAAFHVSPMPLRDCFAMGINVSEDYARELAEGIAINKARAKMIQTPGELMAGPEPAAVSVIDIAEARAKLRYLEADAMIAWRAESLQMQAEMMAVAQASEYVCVCGHEPEDHGRQRQACAHCNCEGYAQRPETPSITVPGGSA